jgi:diguanylate cyclase
MAHMWWKKASTKDEPADPAPARCDSTPEPDAEFDEAIDTIAAVLRAMGDLAVDTDAREASMVRAQCEHWALHVLHLAPVPGAPKGDDRGRAQRRQWLRVRRFAAEVLKEQNDYAQRALASLREAVWAFVRTLSEAVAEDRGADSSVQEKLDRLRSVADSPDPEQIRAEVHAAVSAISTIIEERRRRRQSSMDELGRQLRALGKELERAKREGATDPLTRLLNRKAFDDYAERASQMASLFRTPACLLMVDLDHFKAINDTQGHQTGDEVLKLVADCLTRTFLRKGDMVARYGGEEFAVVLTDTELKVAQTLAARLCATVAAGVVQRGDLAVRVTCSVGVAEIIAGESPADWIARADGALYSAKRAGRNRVVVADPLSSPAPPPRISASVAFAAQAAR